MPWHHCSAVAGAVSGPAMTVLAGVAPLNSANRSAAVPVWWATVCARVNSTMSAVAGAAGSQKTSMSASRRRASANGSGQRDAGLWVPAGGAECGLVEGCWPSRPRPLPGGAADPPSQNTLPMFFGPNGLDTEGIRGRRSGSCLVRPTSGRGPLRGGMARTDGARERGRSRILGGPRLGPKDPPRSGGSVQCGGAARSE